MVAVAEASVFEYTEAKFLWPPRPDNIVPPGMLGFYKRRGFVAQTKKNGTCTVLVKDPAGNLTAFTRHNEAHKLWIPDPSTPCLRKFKELPAKWMVFVGELLHSKVQGIRDTLYLFDMIVDDNKQLVGETFIQRQDRLHHLWPVVGEHDHYYMADERLWIAKPIIVEDLADFFNSLTEPEDEGLVLKDPNAKLEPCRNQTINNKSQVKCRRATKNYTV
jgi:hypothetical protein